MAAFLADAVASSYLGASCFGPRAPPAFRALHGTSSSSSTMGVVSTLRLAQARTSVSSSGNLTREGIARPRHQQQWRRGAEPGNYASMEFMDPKTGEYRTVEIPAEEGTGSEDGESDEELLQRFATAIGLDDYGVTDQLFNKMRSPTSEKIVKQLEDGSDVDQMLKEMYAEIPKFRELYARVERLMLGGQLSLARDIIKENLEAVTDQLDEGIFGVEDVAMLDILSHLYLHLQDENAAEPLLRRAEKLLKSIPDTENMVGIVLEHVAHLYLKIKKPALALPLFTRSLSIKKDSGEDISAIVRNMVGLANTYAELEQMSKSTELYQEILQYSEEVLGADDEDLSAPLMHLGGSLLEDGKLDQAELVIKRALKLTEKTYGRNDGRYGVSLCILAQIKGSQGELEEAVDLFKKGLKVIENWKEYKGEAKVDTVRMDLAALLSVLGREKESKEILMKAGITDEENLNYFSSQQVEYLEKLAESYANAGELEKSEKALRRSLKVLLKNLGPDSVQVSVVLQLLGTLMHGQLDRQAEAEACVREALRIREKNFGRDHPAVGDSCSCLASILHQMERDEEAVALMYRVLHIQEATEGFDNPRTEDSLEVLSMLLMGLGRHEETEPLIERLEQMRSRSGKTSNAIFTL